jgi:dipeptidyl aminopeptidase/acylaminoacyl peptidase
VKLRTVGLLLGLAVAAAPAAARPGTRYTIEQLMASDKITGLSFSPDDSKILFASTRTGVANLYVIPVGGGKPTALTQSSETLAPLGWFPNDERLLYTADQGGNELRHLYVRERDGKVHDVTPGAKVRALFVGWAPDGQSFFVVTNERDPRFLDLYEYRVADYSRQLLFQNDQSYQIRAVSPDRHYVGLSRIADNATTHTYIYDTRTKALRQLTPDRGGVAGEPQVFSLDSKALFLTTDEGREFTYLVRFDIESGERRVVLQTNWDVSGAGLSENGRYLVVATNEDAHTRLRILDPATFAPIVNADTGAGTTESFVIAHHEPLAVFTQANGDVPGDVWTLDLKSGKKSRLMTSLAPGVSQADLVPGEVVRFKSYDGLSIPGVLYVPKGAAKTHKAPAVVWVHGGPGGESRIGYTPLAQYLVNHGYVYYAINNRGSDGSGRTFYHLDDRKHGDADLDDVVASKQMLIDTGYVDPARIAIAGGSYGGFMTLAGLTFRPDAFAAGVDMYGVANWPRLLQNTPAWWEDLRRLLATEMGDVNKDADYLRSISPVLHAERIKKPLLVLQGANDPRVLQQESDDIVAKARANGVPVQYIVFPDEGHGFRKKANEITAYRAIKDFLDAHVRGATSAPK